MIRRATIQDISSLVKLEIACFQLDQLSRRNFRYLLTKANAVIWVIESHQQLLAAAIVLMRKHSINARLYSMAVLPQSQGVGLAKMLLQQIEKDIRKKCYQVMTLEVREDNLRAINFYQKHGYASFGRYAQYYEDQMTAIRMKKNLLSVTDKESHAY